MKLRQFANFLNINSFTYYLIENGYLKPTKKQISKISQAIKEDYSLNMNGDYSYPAPIPKKRTKFSLAILALLKNLYFRIGVYVLLITSLTVMSAGLFYNDQHENHARENYATEYIDFFDTLAEKGTKSISLVNDFIRPEIIAKSDDALYSIKGSYSPKRIDNVAISATFHTAEYRMIFNFFPNLLPLNIVASYANYNTGENFSCNITEAQKNQYELSPIFSDNIDNIDSKVSSIIEQNIKSRLPKLNDTFDSLIKSKLNLEYSLYDNLSSDFYNGSKTLSKLSSWSIFLLFLGLFSSGFFMFLFIYCFIRGKEKNDNIVINMSSDSVVLSRKPHAKTDVFFTPLIPETIFRICGICLVFFGSLRILYYIFTFIGAVGISGNEFQEIPNTMFNLFMIGMFMLYFMRFDTYDSSRKIIQNIFLFLITYICVYGIEVIIMNSLSQNPSLLIQQIINNTAIPNNFGTITCYFIICFTLFYNPKKFKSKKGILCFRLLTIIPISIIIISTLIYNYGNSIWNLNIPIPVLYLFSSEKIQFSLLCIIYLLSLYFLKESFNKKYGNEKAKIIMNGNRFLLIKNSIAVTTLLIISIIELILKNNEFAHQLGLGKYPFIFVLAPFLFLYHPHIGDKNIVADYALKGLYAISIGGIYFIIFGFFVTMLIMTL